MAEDKKTGVQDGKPACTNHVTGAYWGAPCPNCGLPVYPEELKGKNQENTKRNS
jgi:hypothetical protein